jgi:hypothetical protein
MMRIKNIKILFIIYLTLSLLLLEEKEMEDEVVNNTSPYGGVL